MGLAVAVLMAGLADPVASQSPPASEDAFVLAGATIYADPTREPIAAGVVVIRGGLIEAVGPRGSVAPPPNSRVLDCSGLTIVAGLWNNHVHFFERKWADAASIPAAELAGQLEAMLTRYGFTSVFDLGSPWENTRRIRERIESGEVPGPRIRTTGAPLMGRGWLPPDAIMGALGFLLFPSHEVDDAITAREASEELLRAGTDGLKLFAAQPAPPFAALPTSAIEAIVDAARAVGKPVFSHPTDPDGLRAAIAGGVDIIAHTTPQSGPWAEELLAEAGRSGAALIPTLAIWKYQLRHDRASAAESIARTGSDQLRAWVAVGGEVLFGTDVGGMDDYDPGEEYALMARAGMTFRQVLASLTTTPAQRFGDAERLGRIEPGLVADLAILGADPARDVRAFADVRYTLRQGRIIFQSER